MKKYIVAAFVLLIVIFAALIAFMATPEKKKTADVPGDKILYFYSDTCSHCIDQKPILEELEAEGVVFQRMNIVENKQYLTDYGIEGTPTFIFKKIDNKLVGKQTKEALKKFWEDNK